MLNNNEVAAKQAEEEDLDFAKILAFKQSSNNQMEFSRDSHQAKLKLLVKSLNKYVLKQLSTTPQLSDALVISHLALFETLAH